MKKSLIGALVALALGAVALAAVAHFRPGLIPDLGGRGGRADYGLFCDEHGVPEKFCTLCHPDLKKSLLLCPEHGGIPEEICTKCHPDVARKYDIKPCEHGLPAWFCPSCHPESFKGGEAGGAASAGPNLVDDGWCAAFGVKGPDGEAAACKLLPMVRLATRELAGDVGLKTAVVAEEEHAHELTANAETAYDANRYAEINPRVRGYLREVKADLGHAVKAGEVLAVVDSPEVSMAKAQYLSADASLKLAEDIFKRTTSLTAQNLVPRKEEIATRTAFNQAKASLLDAEQRLRNFRFDATALKAIVEHEDTRSDLEITSPIDGTVILRHAVLGEAVEPTSALFTVADESTYWLWIDVYERDLARVREGQPVTFAVSGVSAAPEASYSGKVTWVGGGVDEKTRTAKVRAELPRPGTTLRAKQYGLARIRLEEPHRSLTIPRAAVQRYEGVDLVFLDQSEGGYRPQRIKVRPMDRKDRVEVTWGLKAGQVVVTDGSFLLKTEITKGSIGAGCCE